MPNWGSTLSSVILGGAAMVPALGMRMSGRGESARNVVDAFFTGAREERSRDS